MPLYAEVKLGLYRDSNVLMRLSTQLKAVTGVQDAAVMMGTEVNKALLRDAGLMAIELEDAKPDDLCIAVRSEKINIKEETDSIIRAFFERGPSAPFSSADSPPVRTLDTALRTLPDANLVLISVPGEYAAAEVEKALNRSLNVFLFSDNVPLEEEIRLKTVAQRKGALLMGPDCGSAIIDGVPLGFANEVRRGAIGVVAASGTGLQEVTTLIHKSKRGISHAIGTGGRDLSAEIGGITFLQGLELLLEDEQTEVLVLISKPPDRVIEKRVVEVVERGSKPTVVCFLGGSVRKSSKDEVRFVTTLFDATQEALRLEGQASFSRGLDIPSSCQTKIDRSTNQLGENRRFVRGLYTGGTLADEAALILSRELEPVWALSSFGSVRKLDDPMCSIEHSIFDLGEDIFTLGRPHPMIDPSLRNERLLEEVEDPEVAVFLLDVVLGWGSHNDPAGELAAAVTKARRKLPPSDWPIFVASITGTDLDPQDYTQQLNYLEAAGILVLPSNAQAALTALTILKGRQ